MQYASIMASLPMLRFGEQPALTLAEFRAHCALLTEEDAAELDLLLAGVQEGLQHPFLQAWLNADTQLRNDVARARAEANNQDAAAFLHDYTGYSVLTKKTVEDAMSARDPLEMERTLDTRRWSLLEELSFDDAFGFSGVLAYALKLQLAGRWAVLDDERAAQVLESFIVENLREEGSMATYLDGGADRSK